MLCLTSANIVLKAGTLAGVCECNGIVGPGGVRIGEDDNTDQLC